MRIYLGILLFCGLLITAAPVRAAGFEWDKIGAGSKYTEKEATENWLTFAVTGKWEPLTLKFTGKCFLSPLDDNYEDPSAEGNDSYSKLQAAFSFAKFLKGLNLKIEDKWNRKNEIIYLDIGYQWKLGDSWTAGAGLNESQRRRIIPKTTDVDYNYDAHQQELWFKYYPETWSYTFKLTRTDKDYLGFRSGDGRNSSNIRLALDQGVKWKVNSRLDLGFDYKVSESDYLERNDNTREKAVFKAGYRQNEYWDWDCSYFRSEYNGYQNSSQIDGIQLKCKYDHNTNWWLTFKCGLNDYRFSQGYQYNEDDPDEPKDPDDDYRSRRQTVLSVEFQQKIKLFTYNIEFFVKQYDYHNYTTDSCSDGTSCGGIGTFSYKWGKTDWQLRAAPEGDLTTRKAKYELKVAYLF